MKYSFKRILIIQTAFLGDVVLATGIVKKLNAFYPDATIDFLLKKGNESILSGHPLIRNVLIFNKKKKIGSLLSLISRIRKEKYDLVVNLHRFGSSGFITALSGAGIKTGFDKNPFSFSYSHKYPHHIDPALGIHEMVRNHSLIEKFTDEKPEKPFLNISEETTNKVRHYKESPFITIAPGSVWFTKQYPAEKWVDFIKEVPKNLIIYLLGGPSEVELCDQIKRLSQSEQVFNLAGKLSITESAALMKDAKMNYVNDSAPLHLASSVNAPVAAIFCSTVPGFGFGPVSDNFHIIEVHDPLKCRPCGLHGHRNCPEGHFLCACGIKTGQLLQILTENTGSTQKF